MVFIYNIIMRLYQAGIALYAIRNSKAAKMIAGRKHIATDIVSGKMAGKRNLWVHCASVGEYEQALPLIALLKDHYQETKILVSFFSSSGYEYARQQQPQEWITYLPADNAKAMAEFIERLDPLLVFVIKYEFWYHMLHQLNKRNIPVFLVSGIFRKEQLFFSPLGGLHRKMLSFFTHFFVQNEESKTLLAGLKLNNVTVNGDTRFDRVIRISREPFADPVLDAFVAAGNNVFVAGSTWNSDIPVLKKIIATLPSDWKIIIAPHEMDHLDLDWLEEPYSFYSDNTPEMARVLIINRTGLLSRLYRYAFFVYVGGGFGKSIHNILEPVAYAKPVLIGPEFRKFSEAVVLTATHCVFVVKAENVADVIENEIFNKIKYAAISASLSAYIAANTNVSEKILVYLDRNSHSPVKVF